ncbi:MAG TPA: hypothetical protein VHE55_16875 [Fimbriimonadaceae bacterium]|nr:hypothetical protein [Fimbriimonadaceae bacterium]
MLEDRLEEASRGAQFAKKYLAYAGKWSGTSLGLVVFWPIGDLHPVKQADYDVERLSRYSKLENVETTVVPASFLGNRRVRFPAPPTKTAGRPDSACCTSRSIKRSTTCG